MRNSIAHMQLAEAQFHAVAVVFGVWYAWAKPWRMHFWARVLMNVMFYGLYAASFIACAVSYVWRNGLAYGDKTVSYALIVGLAIPALCYLLMARLDTERHRQSPLPNVEAFFKAVARIAVFIVSYIYISARLWPRGLLSLSGFSLKTVVGWVLLISFTVMALPWLYQLTVPEGDESHLPIPRGYKMKIDLISKIAVWVFLASSFAVVVLFVFDVIYKLS